MSSQNFEILHNVTYKIRYRMGGLWNFLICLIQKHSINVAVVLVELPGSPLKQQVNIMFLSTRTPAQVCKQIEHSTHLYDVENWQKAKKNLILWVSTDRFVTLSLESRRQWNFAFHQLHGIQSFSRGNN